MKSFTLCFVILFIGGMSATWGQGNRQTHASLNNGFMDNAFLIRDYQSKRASSWDRSGGNNDWKVIKPDSTLVLLEESQAGCIRHFYWTFIDSDEGSITNYFRGLVLRMYWDGSGIPSVEVPLGDFFGVSNGLVRNLKSLTFITNPSQLSQHPLSWGFNCYLPMPFARDARIEIENQGPCPARIWYHIDYEIYKDDSTLPANSGRLHAQWNISSVKKSPMPRSGNSNLSGKDNYTILEVKGNGQFVGYFLTVINHERQWWGEGDDMVFIDGEEFPPSIHGTGTEEIFGGGACPDIEYTGPYTGFHCIENRQGFPWSGTNGMYRFYLVDPIRFKKSIRVSIEQGDNNDKAGINDYCSTAFWYQLEVNQYRQPLPPLEKRKVNYK
jgi:hypothetical protein